MDIQPDPDVDAYLKASAVEGVRKSPVTQYMIRLLGLEVLHHLLHPDNLQLTMQSDSHKFFPLKRALSLWAYS